MADYGTCTVTETPLPRGRYRVRFAWTCRAAPNGDVVYAYTPCQGVAWRRLLQIETNPTDGPTADYDVTITNSHGIDLLQGHGADRHTTNSEIYVFGGSNAPPAVLDAALVFNVANAGDAKSGVCDIIVGD